MVPWTDPVDRKENWQALSICGPEHDEILFAGGRKGRKRDKLIAKAKDLCACCPVRSDCFQKAVDNGEKNGVWGGHDFSDGVSVRTTQRRKQNNPTKENES